MTYHTLEVWVMVVVRNNSLARKNTSQLSFCCAYLRGTPNQIKQHITRSTARNWAFFYDDNIQAYNTHPLKRKKVFPLQHLNYNTIGSSYLKCVP